jgi:hypothetical protein
MRTGHDRAGVNKEIMAGKPRAVHQIRQRLTGLYPSLKQGLDRRLLARGQRLIPGDLITTGVEFTGFEYQPGGLVKGIVGTMTEAKTRRIEGIGYPLNLLL